MTSCLVFLDLSDMDMTLMRQIAELHKSFKIDRLYIAHYIELQEFSGSLKAHFPEMERPIEDILNEELMERAMESGLGKDHIEVVIFQEGSKSNMINWINESEVELCVIGKKTRYKGTGIFSGRMARMLEKPILFTTESSRLEIQNTLVAIDFSNFSKKALELYFQLISNDRQRLIAYHVFRLPGVYFPFLGGDSKVLQESQAKEKLNQLHKFTAGISTGKSVEHAVEFAGDRTLGSAINDYAKNRFVDLIVIGVKGKTDKDELLIGSVAEQVITQEHGLPILLVK